MNKSIESEEYQYLKIVEDIIDNGELRHGRDGIITLSKFYKSMKFSLKEEIFPLITTKKMFFRGIVEELLWMIKGSTNSKDLESKGVNIWKKNGSKENLKKLGFNNREEGDLGPIYGFQWRHYGAEYTTCDEVYSGGIDQLQNCIDMIKNTPTSRRIILDSWNVKDLDKMVLPPCHVLYHFYVSNNKELSCYLYQRSGDFG
jgi:thymidylate synthase